MTALQTLEFFAYTIAIVIGLTAGVYLCRALG
jgi:hypothetical protein